MKSLNIILIVIIALSFTACYEDVIKVDLETAEPRLVIDASIDWIKGTTGNEQKIKLTTTTGYYEDKFPTVSGATITVANTKNIVFQFIESTNKGEYICTNFESVIGETYTLTVNLNGETYTATETFISVPAIEDSIQQNNKGGMAGDEIEITYYYKDNGAEYNYYLYSVAMRHIVFPQYSVENNEMNQGALTAVYYSHEDLEVGDVLNLELYGISKRYYDYMAKLLLASGNDDGPMFAPTPAAVRGNIVNQTDSKNFAYGYFRLSEVDVKDYTIKE